MISPFFAKENITNFTDAQKCDTKKFATFFWKMIENGVFLPPSQFESWFLCSALTHSDMRKFESAVDVFVSSSGRGIIDRCYCLPKEREEKKNT